MKAENIRELPWRKVQDWKDLTTSHSETEDIFFTRTYYVTESDIDIFVKNVYKDISRQLNIPYKELEPILREENEPFNQLKEEIYSRYNGLERKDAPLCQLKELLRIPDTTEIEKFKDTNKLEECLELYEQLSDIEKIQFLKETGDVDIKMEYYVTKAKMVD